MLEQMKSVSNPLTIIALVAALAAILFPATCAASSMAEKSPQQKARIISGRTRLYAITATPRQLKPAAPNIWGEFGRQTTLCLRV